MSQQNASIVVSCVNHVNALDWWALEHKDRALPSTSLFLHLSAQPWSYHTNALLELDIGYCKTKRVKRHERNTGMMTTRRRLHSAVVILNTLKGTWSSSGHNTSWIPLNLFLDSTIKCHCFTLDCLLNWFHDRWTVTSFSLYCDFRLMSRTSFMLYDT